MKNRMPESFQDATPFERRLIDAGRTDRVPDALQLRMAQALSSLPPLAASHEVAQAASAGAHTTRGLLFSQAGLWGTLSAAVLIGVVSWRVTSNPRPASSEARVMAATTGVVGAEPVQAALSSAVAEPPSAAKVVLSAPEPAAPAAAASGGPSRPRAAGGLREELALLDAARSALSERDGARALRLLDQHARRFSRGRLAPEADALRIEALVQRGDATRAERLSRRFVERHPLHPLASHIANIANPER